MNFEYFNDIKEYHTVWKMTEQKNKHKKLEDQEIHFIELPKFLKSKVDMNRKLDQWLSFIDYSKKEWVDMAKEKNNMVREAIAAYEYLTATDEVEKERAYLRMKYELDYNSGLDNARRKGIKEGLEKVVKKMLINGMDISTIKEITGMTEDEIEEIKKKP